LKRAVRALSKVVVFQRDYGGDEFGHKVRLEKDRRKDGRRAG